MRFRYLALFALACIPFLFLIPKGAHAVRQDNLILSSAVEGQILDHGKPVAGLKVQRKISWNMEAEARTEITSTDEDGRFQFPEVRGAAEFGFLAKLFHVPTILLDVNLLDEKKSSTSLFSVVRSSYGPAVETGYEVIQMSCDLKDRQMFRDRLSIIDCQVRLTAEMEKGFE
jgi:5-hydroxyisourate hydrolase-like protein (transthyretin family)